MLNGIPMKKLLSLICVVVLTTLSSLPMHSQQRSKGGLQDKRVMSLLTPLEKVHLCGSEKQEEIAKTRKLTDAEILCVYEGHTVDSIELHGWEWYQSYLFYKDGSLSKYTEANESSSIELFISNHRIVRLVTSEGEEGERGQVKYIPIGNNTYLLQVKTMQGEEVGLGLDGSKITFDDKGRIIAIAYTYDGGESYNVVSKFRYDKFGNARNEEGQLCIPILNHKHLDRCTKLILKRSPTKEYPFVDELTYGLSVDADFISDITIFIKDFNPTIMID